MKTSGDRRLIPVIGRWSLMALIVNSVVGAGIFGLPSSVARQVGDFAPWAYLLGALMTAVTVSVVVELSSQFHEPGGAYLYVREAFGSFVGLQTGWFSWLAKLTTAAAIANLLMSYLAGLLPFFPGTLARDLGVLCVVGGLAAINTRGVKMGALVSNIFTVAKLLPLITLVILGVMRDRHPTGAASATELPNWKTWVDVLIAMVFAYSGFETAMIPGSELKNPRRDAPVAAFSALLIISALYVCLHLVVMRAVPDMASTERPLSDAAAVYVGGPGRVGIALAAVASTFGWLSAAVVTTPRLTLGMVEKGDLPALFGAVHPRFRTPWVSIWLWALLVVALVAVGDFYWNVVLSVAARLVVYSTMCAAAIKLQKKYPDRDAWRAPGGPLLPGIGIGICGLLATRLHREHLILMSVVASFGLISWIHSQKRGQMPRGEKTMP